ncbi:Holliday junction resolvase RuvX [Cardiobacteriaceae bacterium TAE3-ERU3]|nr:Holliday junction resolvase RuvX [Cardiobacteriaceae bacterium TAE3-ERU3]
MSTVKWVLGIDPGRRKTGVAIGQSLTGTARPLGIIQAPLEKIQANHFSDYIEQWRPSMIIVGEPKLADGNAHPMAEDIQQLISMLSAAFDLPVETFDEFLSSHEAKQLKPKQRQIDDLAAVIILESWFQS